MAANWYALRSKPRKEEVVWKQIRSQGFEVYYPRLRVNPVNPRSRKLRPYFPGYLFVFADLDDVGVSVFQWMPHSIGLVSFGGEPAAVPENLIHALRKRVDEISAAGGEIFDGLHPGDVVRISEGPFRGYEAIFDARLPGSERVRVLLELLGSQRRVPMELSAGQIQRKK
jgi:transcription antitermination factor NusG